MRILIANRGEIALRIIRACRELGHESVAVYSEIDRTQPHVLAADLALPIGPAPARESYLNQTAILAAAQRARARAIHPGYGFLAENADFARAVQAAGLIWIGPPPDVIELLGSKTAARELARRVGAPIVPGTDPLTDAVTARRFADKVGYPILLKAVGGGGGKGMRVVRAPEEIEESLARASSEGKAFFADERVYAEKVIEHPRHIEVQILGDRTGTVVHFGERECSLQRRHQKVVEETPSVAVDAELRRRLGEAAVAVARGAGYRSAGTVEFLLGQDGSFYFLEVNTRLQVEHPVTELITGLDLVEQMIRVAAGEKLTISQADVKINGWAMECRINAEDPFRGFLPSTGRLVKFQPPAEIDGQVRVDTGVYDGGEISMYYDSMIAKLITHGANRDQAIERMREALNAFVIRGISSNIPFQAALMQHPRFMSGIFDTSFIAKEYPQGFDASLVPHDDPLLFVTVAAALHRGFEDRDAQLSGQMPGHERVVGDDYTVIRGEERTVVNVVPASGGYDVTVGGETFAVRTEWQFGEILVNGTVNGRPFTLQMEKNGLKYRMNHNGTQATMMVMSARWAELQALMPVKLPPDMSKFLLSPMPGLLREVAVAEGQEVKAGEKLAVIEAMKMENVLKAEQDGKVKKVVAKPGASLAVDEIIVEFE